MHLSEIKTALQQTEELNFLLPDGSFVPEHFHVTEIGIISKHFIDCGGTIRTEKKANFQLWEASDTDHRLKPQKLLDIIQLCEKKLGIEDLEIEVEYQQETIGKYGIHFNGQNFILTAMQTACLASDSCGAPALKQKTELSEMQTQSACCSPGGGCC